MASQYATAVFAVQSRFDALYDFGVRRRGVQERRVQVGIIQEHGLAPTRVVGHGAALVDGGRALDRHDRAADEAAGRALDDGGRLASRL